MMLEEIATSPQFSAVLQIVLHHVGPSRHGEFGRLEHASVRWEKPMICTALHAGD
jgi:hypothetical protein